MINEMLRADQTQTILSAKFFAEESHQSTDSSVVPVEKVEIKFLTSQNSSVR